MLIAARALDVEQVSHRRLQNEKQFKNSCPAIQFRVILSNEQWFHLKAFEMVVFVITAHNLSVKTTNFCECYFNFGFQPYFSVQMINAWIFGKIIHADASFKQNQTHTFITVMKRNLPILHQKQSELLIARGKMSNILFKLLVRTLRSMVVQCAGQKIPTHSIQNVEEEMEFNWSRSIYQAQLTTDH